jgi:FAD/FMN-containing dehydrogenase
LFVGSHGSLGIVVEVTFKLRPLPEAEQFVRARCGSLEEAGALMESIFESEITPVALDLHDLPSLPAQRAPLFSLVAGFAGTVEEVEWQRARAAELGLNEATTLDHEKQFWKGDSPPRRVSVAPSKVIETIRVLGEVPFVARAGNGVVYYRGGPPPAKDPLPVSLMQRLKSEFDPRHILPELAL